MSKKDKSVVRNQAYRKSESATTAKLKKLAKDEMISRDILSYGMHKVNTTVAYDVWGIDINDLEERRKKLKALELQ